MHLCDDIDSELVHHIFLKLFWVGAKNGEWVVGSLIRKEGSGSDEVVEGIASDFGGKVSCSLYMWLVSIHRA